MEHTTLPTLPTLPTPPTLPRLPSHLQPILQSLQAYLLLRYKMPTVPAGVIIPALKHNSTYWHKTLPATQITKLAHWITVHTWLLPTQDTMHNSIGYELHTLTGVTHALLIPTIGYTAHTLRYTQHNTQHNTP